jgi:hypothetical protein
MPEIAQKFVVGTRIRMFRDAEPEAVDEGIVESITGGLISQRQMKVCSLTLYPGETKEYGLFRQGWKMVFVDSITGVLTHSGEKGPVFRFEP